MSIIFGNQLKKLRNENGYTQQDIAKLFNVSKMTISAWENDKQEPSIEDISKLAIFFKVSTDYLLGLVNEFGAKTKEAEEYKFKLK